MVQVTIFYGKWLKSVLEKENQINNLLDIKSVFKFWMEVNLTWGASFTSFYCIFFFKQRNEATQVEVKLN